MLRPGMQAASQTSVQLASNVATTSALPANAAINDQYSSVLAELYRFDLRLTAEKEKLRERVADCHLQLRRTLMSQSRARLAASR